MLKVEFLGHKVSHNGLEAKELSVLTGLAFPVPRRAMQSFLGSLNYYSRFIEDFAIYASVLYELREIYFAAMMKDTTQVRIQRVLKVENQTIDRQKTLDLEAQDLTEVNPRWIHAYRSFSVLKSNIATTPILLHFEPDRRATVVGYASDWAISGSLMQEYDKIYYPVIFASRTLKSNELNYGIAEKEVLVLRRILDLNYNALVGRPIHVLARHSTLAWRSRSTALQGRLALEITKCVNGEDEILRALAASITPRSDVGLDCSQKGAAAQDPGSDPHDEHLYAARFDGPARVRRGGGAYSPNLWKLPAWRVLKARSGYAEGLTEDLDPRRLVICGDSNLVIQQVRGEIDCKAPGLTLLRQRALDRLRIWPDHKLLHVKQDWNGSADGLAGAALQRQCGIEGLVTFSRLDEVLVARVGDEVAQIFAVTTRSKARSGEVVRELRIEQVRQTQDEESWISGLNKSEIWHKKPQSGSVGSTLLFPDDYGGCHGSKQVYAIGGH
ncbi:reverse transcriptase [Phytophthora megakarya]|uniref:Reverse transcriptase n=1 Tax=Phytophthora megakarya TaxID=4795 RepID=A0A225WKR0_9STRA|nr:reverse transcriptase [Phytophthora megakarya]